MTILFIRTNKRIKKYTKGFSLVELIVVISIIAFLSTIVVPAYNGYIKKAEEEVCNANILQLKRMYNVHLDLDNIEHTDTVFEQFLQECCKSMCPDHGNIAYVDGRVRCSIHVREEDTESGNDDDGDVPFL
jgi:prepilin-type N-terminal cleavage/methylation domain-containing protein/prepilin-type processing-associated H-X9-DG protein